MHAPAQPVSEILVPATLFGDLRAALENEAGSLVAVHALHAAGYANGVAAAAAVRNAPDEDLMALPQDVFWNRVTSFLARRGWGNLTREDSHEAVGLLTSPDWAEGTGPAGDDASCSFSAGFFSGLLTTLAGGPVAVLEITCRARGDERCSFAFGNAAAIHGLYGKLVEGSDLPSALASL